MDIKSGHCLCGAAKFTVKINKHPDGVHVDACHCSMCRRQIDGPLMGISLASAPEIEDENALATYQSSEWAERSFCKNCGSNLFYRLKSNQFHTVHAGAMDDISDAKLALEIFIDDKPSYYHFAQDTQKMTGEQVMAVFASGESAY